MNYKKKPTKLEVMNTLVLFGNKNPKIYKLIKTFGLVDEAGVINNININQKKQENMAKQVSKFKNEVESDSYEKIAFIKFETEGEIVEGEFLGSVQIDFKAGKGAETIYKINIDGTPHYLPSNVQLNNKMAKLEKIMKDSQADSVEVQITFTGFEKLDGGKKAKQFQVLTA